MNYGKYRCPICNGEVERDLTVYLCHTDEHMIETLKELHPNWVSEDGTCEKCKNYLYEQLSQPYPNSISGK